MSTLYIVATPIGNLEDITLRAIRILKEVDYVICEDTRTTKTLLKTYGINTPTISFHAKSARSRITEIGKLLTEGKNMALVSDAGTPCISDPGVLVVEHAYTLPNVTVVPIPGPSALTTVLSVLGESAHPVTFYGFIPHKKGRDTLFKTIAETKQLQVMYESPHRLMKTLASLNQYIGSQARIVTVFRELTKIYESRISGSASFVLEHFTKYPDQIRGECVVVVGAITRNQK